MGKSISGILEGIEDEESAEMVAEAPEPTDVEPDEGVAENLNAEAEQEVPEAQPEHEPAPETKDEPEKGWSYHAYKDEKDKRQALETELGTMRRQLHDFQQRQAAPVDVPDFYDDPAGFMGQQIARMEQARLDDRLNMSEAIARRTLGDDVVSKAQEWALAAGRADPALGARIVNSADPYGEAVHLYQQASAMQEMGGDPVTWQQRERERIKAEILAEMQATNPGNPQPKPVMPTPAGTVRNVGTRSGPAWSGPRPIGEILGDG